MFDAVVLSDLHLGSENCRAKALVQFLEAVRDGCWTERPCHYVTIRAGVVELCEYHEEAIAVEELGPGRTHGVVLSPA